MFGVLMRMLRRLSASYHGVRGRIAYRMGSLESARRHFERVLALGGDEFLAYVHFGRIALGEGDFAGYRREMGNARGCDPDRFARMQPAADGLESRIVGSPFEEAGERATWRSVRPGNQGIARRAPVHSAELPTESDDGQRQGPVFELPQMDLGPRPPAARGSRDDFCTSQERERFRQLPPIARSELGQTDVDDLARRLGS